MGDVALNKKACFELFVQNNCDTEMVTDEVFRRKINASYFQIRTSARQYYNALSNNSKKDKQRYLDAFEFYNNKIVENDRFGETVYKFVNLNLREKDKYVDIESNSAKRAASEFNIPKTRVLELYYQYLFQIQKLKSFPNNYQSEMTILRKYLFYVYINHHLDATVFQFLPSLSDFSSKYNKFQDTLEKYLKPYLDSTCLLHITDGEKEYLDYMIGAHANMYGNILNDKQDEVKATKEIDPFVKEFSMLLDYSDEDMFKYFEKMDSKYLKKWLSLGLEKTKYSNIYYNLVSFMKEKEDKVKEIFMDNLKDNQVFSSMFETIKKIIPCLGNGFDVPDNISKYLNREKFNYIDLCAMTGVSVEDILLFVQLLKKYDDKGSYFSLEQYVSLERFLRSCQFNRFSFDVGDDLSFSLDKEMKTKKYIKGHEIDDNDLEKTKSLLERWNVPISRQSYNMALSRYVDGELENRYNAFSEYGHSDVEVVNRSR